MRSCKSCGCVNDNINRYCRNCGSPMAEELPARPIGNKYEPEPVMEEPVSPVPEVIPPAPGEDEPTPEEYEEYESGEDFFTIIPSDENALFCDLPPAEEDRKDYIDFDIGPAEEPPATDAPTAGERLAEATRSGVYITLAVLATLGFILGTVRLALGLMDEGAGIVRAVGEIAQALFILGFERIGAYGIAAYAAPVAAAAGLCLSVPAVLYLIGIWLHLGCGRASLWGLRLISAGTVIGCILCALALLSTGIAGIAVLASRLYSPPELAPVMDGALVLLGVLGLAFTVGIVYHCLALGSVAGLKAILRGNAVRRRVSVFVMTVNLACSIGAAAASGFCFGGADLLGGGVYLINTLNFAVLTLYMAKLRVELKENE